jgi:hypothetical protein
MTFLTVTSLYAPHSVFSPRSGQEDVEQCAVIHGRSERLPWVPANGKHDLGYGTAVYILLPSPDTAGRG